MIYDFYDLTNCLSPWQGLHLRCRVLAICAFEVTELVSFVLYFYIHATKEVPIPKRHRYAQQ